MSAPSVPVLRCQSCNETYRLDTAIWKCRCGSVLDVAGAVMFPKDQLAHRPMSFWRYREALALPDSAPVISLGEVITPLLDARFRGWNVSLKLEYVLPTGSYKDRGVAVCLDILARSGVRSVAEDSSGNAGASTAAYAAAAGIRADIYIPEGASPAKVNQIRIYGAQCHLVPGTRTESAREAQAMRDDGSCGRCIAVWLHVPCLESGNPGSGAPSDTYDHGFAGDGSLAALAGGPSKGVGAKGPALIGASFGTRLAKPGHGYV